MADVEISYKGSTIATMSASGTKTLLTEGKYCEDDITVEYTSPGGGGGSLVITDEANATGTTAVITVGGGGGGTWETIYEGSPSANADSPYNYFWLSSLSDVYPAANEVYRITADNSEYVVTAASAVTSMGTVVCVGNPKYSGGTDDGSGIPINFVNAGWGAWTGDTELSAGTHSLKIEHQVTA